MIVVDASVLAPALADDGEDGDAARSRLRGQRLAAPELIDLETASALRSQLQNGLLDDRRAKLALAELLDVALVTADARMAHARGPRCEIELVARP